MSNDCNGDTPGHEKRASIDTEALSAFRIVTEIACQRARGQVQAIAPQLRAVVIADCDNRNVRKLRGLTRKTLARAEPYPTDTDRTWRDTTPQSDPYA